MSGPAWEQKPTVLVGILHVENVTLAWAFGLRNLIIPGGIAPVSGMPFDHARNAICMAALDSGADFVFHLDSDVIPPKDAIIRLMHHNLPIVSGVYCRRSPPHGKPVAMINGQWVSTQGRTGLMEVDVVGAGCLLIRRDVLQRLPAQDPARGKHWFDWRVDMNSPDLKHSAGHPLSEDFTLCRWAREQLKVPILLDTEVRCKHVGFFEVEEDSAQPLFHNPKT